jgi:hypothetical protein
LGKFQFRGHQNIWLAADPNRVGAAYPSTNTVSQGRQQYFKWNLTNYFTYNKYLQTFMTLITAGIDIYNGSEEQLTISRRKKVNSDAKYWALANVDYSGNGKFQRRSF